jgi:hypothetical protein
MLSMLFNKSCFPLASWPSGFWSASGIAFNLKLIFQQYFMKINKKYKVGKNLWK